MPTFEGIHYFNIIMKKYLSKLCLLGLVLTIILISCATSSPIARLSESKGYFREEPRLISNNYPKSNIYTLYEKGATGFVTISSLRSNLERRAEIFASRQNKSFIILGEKISEPPYILGNFPRIQIVFALIDKQ